MFKLLRSPWSWPQGPPEERPASWFWEHLPSTFFLHLVEPGSHHIWCVRQMYPDVWVPRLYTLTVPAGVTCVFDPKHSTEVDSAYHQQISIRQISCHLRETGCLWLMWQGNWPRCPFGSHFSPIWRFPYEEGWQQRSIRSLTSQEEQKQALLQPFPWSLPSAAIWHLTPKRTGKRPLVRKWNENKRCC